MGWQVRFQWTAAVFAAVVLTGCSGGDDAVTNTTVLVAPPVEATVATTFTPAPAVDPAQAEDWARSFATLVSAGDVGAAAALFAPGWTKVGIPMTEGGWGVVPPEAATDSFGVSAELAEGLEFLSAWIALDLGDCEASAVSPSRAQVRCVAELSGPYPKAMGLEPFELPMIFTAGEEGLIEFGTDFTAAESGRFVPDTATERYLGTLPDFVLYTASDRDFTAEYTLGSGRPVVTQESAAAHLAKAEEWVAAGSP